MSDTKMDDLRVGDFVVQDRTDWPAVVYRVDEVDADGDFRSTPVFFEDPCMVKGGIQSRQWMGNHAFRRVQLEELRKFQKMAADRVLAAEVEYLTLHRWFPTTTTDGRTIWCKYDSILSQDWAMAVQKASKTVEP